MKDAKDAKKMKDGKRLLAMKVFAATFALLLILFWVCIVIAEMGKGPIGPIFFVTLIPLIGILAILFIMMRRISKSVESGMPLKDERIRRIENKAGNYTTQLTLYFLLVLAFYIGFGVEDYGWPMVPVRYIAWIVFFFVAAVFFGLRWQFSRKGDA